jgi:N-acetylglucosaminyl-diphospho-decaprenol L-rhamnosyltransferase
MSTDGVTADQLGAGGLPPGRIGVVTVSFGSEAVLEGFLESLPTASSHEIVAIVADNKVEAGAPAAALAERFGALYLPLPDNRGYGGAMNAAIRELPEDIRWILISNPDIEIKPGAIDELMRVGEADARVAAVGPLVMTDGEVYPSARALPSLGNGIGHALFARIWRSNPFTASYRNDTELPPRERDAGWAAPACWCAERPSPQSADSTTTTSCTSRTSTSVRAWAPTAG